MSVEDRGGSGVGWKSALKVDPPADVHDGGLGDLGLHQVGLVDINSTMKSGRRFAGNRPASTSGDARPRLVEHRKDRSAMQHRRRTTQRIGQGELG